MEVTKTNPKESITVKCVNGVCYCEQYTITEDVPEGLEAVNHAETMYTRACEFMKKHSRDYLEKLAAPKITPQQAVQNVQNTFQDNKCPKCGVGIVGPDKFGNLQCSKAHFVKDNNGKWTNTGCQYKVFADKR